MSKVIKTAVTEKLGIKYPIFQGGMAWIVNAEMVAAVANAGGLGILPSGTCADADALRSELKRIKELTDKPYAVNFTFMPSLASVDYPAYLKVCIEEGVKIIETSGMPAKPPLMEAMKKAGMIVIHKCTTVKHALKAQSIGCDMVVADGCECAGHSGETDIGSIVLTPRCVEELSIPVVTAGGIANGKQMAAALMMGAEGVYLGTRMLLTKECPVLDSVKQYLAENADETCTAYLLRAFRNTTRLYKSNVVKEALEKEKNGCEFSTIAEAVAGATAKKMFYENGDVENCGVISYGQAGGLCHSVISIQEVIDTMMAECVKALGRFDA